MRKLGVVDGGPGGAVETAVAAAQAAGVTVREIATLAEAEEVVRLYSSIWGRAENPPMTLELLRAFTKAGNYVGGAYAGDRLVGACVGFFHAPADDALHSHIAGVANEMTGRHVGFALKLHQRAWALGDGGVSEIAWTFDPLVSRNAYFNIAKLAGEPVEYLPNFYGAMPDAINGYDDSDRLLVRWRLRDPAVVAACAGQTRQFLVRDELDRGATVGLALDETGAPVPGQLDGRTVLVAVPRDISLMRTGDRALAGRWRVALREALTALVADGGMDRRLRPIGLVRRTEERMKLAGVELRRISMPLVSPFRTSFGTQTTRDVMLLRVVTDEAEGWGECVAMSDPLYSSEYVDAAADVLRRFLLPGLAAVRGLEAPMVAGALARFKGHRMAKAALEMGVLDAELRATNRSFARELGAVRERVPCGVSVGIMDSVPALLDAVDGYLAEGYLRIKLKIEPGWDVEPVRAVRERFGDDVLLQVDANTAYTLADARHLARLDPFNLLLIEQPLDEEDILGHADLARHITTPICLDESILSAQSAAAAIRLGACQVVNIKPGRVGGYLEARRIHDVCAAHGIPVWCGGMLETGPPVAAANVALAALPGFTLPGDTSASDRYYRVDVTEPFVLDDGHLAVPDGPGLRGGPVGGRARHRHHSDRVARVLSCRSQPAACQIWSTPTK